MTVPEQMEIDPVNIDQIVERVAADDQQDAHAQENQDVPQLEYVDPNQPTTMAQYIYTRPYSRDIAAAAGFRPVKLIIDMVKKIDPMIFQFMLLFATQCCHSYDTFVDVTDKLQTHLNSVMKYQAPKNIHIYFGLFVIWVLGYFRYNEMIILTIVIISLLHLVYAGVLVYVHKNRIMKLSAYELIRLYYVVMNPLVYATATMVMMLGCFPTLFFNLPTMLLNHVNSMPCYIVITDPGNNRVKLD